MFDGENDGQTRQTDHASNSIHGFIRIFENPKLIIGRHSIFVGSFVSYVTVCPKIRNSLSVVILALAILYSAVAAIVAMAAQSITATAAVPCATAATAVVVSLR